ncbi:MAG: transglycosylase domain-containing protein [Longimicrobiaceae bacterium]
MARSGRRRMGVGVMRRKQTDHRYGILGLLLVAALMVGGMGGFFWSQGRQLQNGLLAQRSEAAKSGLWTPLDSFPGYLVAAFRTAAGPDESAAARHLVEQAYRLDGEVLDRVRARVMAGRLDHLLSDSKLLELYLNRVRLGQKWGWQVYGVTAAAREYFGKEPAGLTLSEAATLAGFTLPPPIRDPLGRAGPAGARRNDVLRRMAAGRIIGEAAYRRAVRERLGFQPGLEHAPMTRPAGWLEEPEPLRLTPLPRDPAPAETGVREEE